MKTSSLLLQCIKAFQGWLALSVILGVAAGWISGISMMVLPALTLALLGHQLEPSSSAGPLRYLAAFVDRLPSENHNIWIATTLIGVMALKYIAAFANDSAFNQLTRYSAQKLRTQAIDTLLNADVSVLSGMKSGKLAHVIGFQIDETARYLAAASQLFSFSANLVAYGVMMLLISVPLTAVTLALFLLAFWVNSFMIQRAREFGQIVVDEGNNFTANLLDLFNGIRVVKIAATEERERTRLLEQSWKSVNNHFRLGQLGNSVAPITEFTAFVAIIGIVLVSTYFFQVQQQGQSTLVITFLFLVFRALTQAGSINNKRAALAGFYPAVESLANFLGSTPAVASGSVPFGALRDNIAFESVTFQYAHTSKTALRDFSLTLKRGTITALVGASGAGKTTVADLLCRFYDPTEGVILVDGTDLKELDLSSWRKRIGVVSQDPFLFNDTIEFNIRYAKPHATDSEFADAICKSHCDEFIANLPLGLASPVGERGGQLSAGQRQRISIARALLVNPDILILDEATSALDSISEKAVQSALVELMYDRTTLVIAHRLATVREAHQIVVIESGRIIETGTHEQLLSANGLYHKMCEVGKVVA